MHHGNVLHILLLIDCVFTLSHMAVLCSGVIMCDVLTHEIHNTRSVYGKDECVFDFRSRYESQILGFIVWFVAERLLAFVRVCWGNKLTMNQTARVDCERKDFSGFVFTECWRSLCQRWETCRWTRLNLDACGPLFCSIQVW